jgi:hypothetical protein
MNLDVGLTHCGINFMHILVGGRKEPVARLMKGFRTT